MTENADEIPDMEESNFVESLAVLVCRGGTVLLTREEVEGILSTKEGVVV